MIQVLLGSVASALVLGPLFLLWSLPNDRRGANAVSERPVAARTRESTTKGTR